MTRRAPNYLTPREVDVLFEIDEQLQALLERVQRITRGRVMSHQQCLGIDQARRELHSFVRTYADTKIHEPFIKPTPTEDL